jgi:hypothetical protein
LQLRHVVVEEEPKCVPLLIAQFDLHSPPQRFVSAPRVVSFTHCRILIASSANYKVLLG